MCEQILKKKTAPQYNSNSLNCKKKSANQIAVLLKKPVKETCHKEDKKTTKIKPIFEKLNNGLYFCINNRRVTDSIISEFLQLKNIH